MAEPLMHFTHTDDLSVEQLNAIIRLALQIANEPGLRTGALADQLLVNLFYEASTRTRVSFETAAKRLGMHVVNVTALGSSVEKGESLHDTFYTLEAMQPDVVVVRHPEEGTARQLADRAEPGVHVINAGDGTSAHPTQALLDAVTLIQHFGSLSRVRLLLAGDIRHSRVARSCLALLPRLGIGELRVAGPEEFLSRQELPRQTAVFTDFDRALEGVDAVMMLRIQKERIAGLHMPDAADYHRDWGLTEQRLALASGDCRVLHPGPINRGVEIDPAVADGPRSLIRRQVHNGLHTRMALLLALAGHDED